MSERYLHAPISEPSLIIPIGEPWSEANAPVEFAFRPQTRAYWLRVANNQCQMDYYDENRGWVTCGSDDNLQVHHIIPEAWQLEHGMDPEHSVGMVVCRYHHANFQDRTLDVTPFEQSFSWHPDIGYAFQNYHQWKDAGSVGPSPFERAVHWHRDMVDRGERFWAGDDATDMYYLQKMEQLAWDHYMKTGETAPVTEPHKLFDPSKRGWIQ